VVSSTPRPYFTPGKDPVPILQEAWWNPGPVWSGGKSRPHRDSIPDRPCGSQSLYRLSYPAHSEGVQHVLWNSQVHDRVNKGLPLLDKLIRTSFFFRMHLNVTFPIPQSLQVVSSLKAFLPNFLNALLTDSMHATCRAHPIVLSLIVLIIDAQQKP